MTGTLLLQGPLATPSSFTFVNRRLVDGLRAAGWALTALASDEPATKTPAVPRPDVYLFHGHPYDITDAPGRVNAFYLSYDYARFAASDPHLAVRLNACFDVLFVPSRFVRNACRRSGVRIPTVVCPYGVDPREFSPDTPPVTIPGRRRFCFVNVGGANTRKGTDILVKAYARAFTGDDDVTLVIKAFAYDHLAGWAADVIDGAMRGQANPPHLHFEHDTTASVAGYFTAADMGVFPFRGEGFGLPILECLASGVPAIVTASGGPRDYGRSGVTWLRSRALRRPGPAAVEPDRQALERLMRTAVEQGPSTAASRQRIVAATRRYSWSRTVETIHGRLADVLARKARRTAPPGPPPRKRPLSTAYCFYGTGTTSWKRHGTKIDRLLSRWSPRHRSSTFDRPTPVGAATLVVGQSGFCLEGFLQSTRRDDTRRLLHRESAPLETMLRLANRERRACGMPPAPVPAMNLWRDRHETDLADVVVVASERTRRLFEKAGYDPGTLRVVPLGIDLAAPHRRAASAKPRLLFVGGDPFRKGIRVVLEAWRRVDAPDAELWCVSGAELLKSRVILRHLVTDDRISVRPYMSHHAFLRLYEQVDAVVLPSMEEGFGLAVADGMIRGKPGIVSASTGVSEIIASGENGLVVRTGDVEALAAAMQTMCDDRRLVRRLGDAAHDTARMHTWRRFASRFAAVLDELADGSRS